ncbi:unnamed protein product [Amoebophrya sp. A25]|nr:unnamed protein product [Amoebophrya sp. A25]|eukprot:GSA25T00000644001.1
MSTVLLHIEIPYAASPSRRPRSSFGPPPRQVSGDLASEDHDQAAHIVASDPSAASVFREEPRDSCVYAFLPLTEGTMYRISVLTEVRILRLRSAGIVVTAFVPESDSLTQNVDDDGSSLGLQSAYPSPNSDVPIGGALSASDSNIPKNVRNGANDGASSSSGGGGEKKSFSWSSRDQCRGSRHSDDQVHGEQSSNHSCDSSHNRDDSCASARGRRAESASRRIPRKSEMERVRHRGSVARDYVRGVEAEKAKAVEKNPYRFTSDGDFVQVGEDSCTVGSMSASDAATPRGGGRTASRPPPLQNASIKQVGAQIRSGSRSALDEDSTTVRGAAAIAKMTGSGVPRPPGLPPKPPPSAVSSQRKHGASADNDDEESTIASSRGENAHCGGGTTTASSSKSHEGVVEHSGIQEEHATGSPCSTQTADVDTVRNRETMRKQAADLELVASWIWQRTKNQFYARSTSRSEKGKRPLHLVEALLRGSDALLDLLDVLDTTQKKHKPPHRFDQKMIAGISLSFEGHARIKHQVLENMGLFLQRCSEPPFGLKKQEHFTPLDVLRCQADLIRCMSPKAATQDTEDSGPRLLEYDLGLETRMRAILRCFIALSRRTDGELVLQTREYSYADLEERQRSSSSISRPGND